MDLWRVTMREQTTRNSEKEIETVMAALKWAKQTGKARFTGISTHHRPWIADAVAKYPQLEVIVTPYSAGSKEKPVGSMFEALRHHDVGFIGIKPFASGSVFKSGGQPDSATRQEDDERARLALRYVLCCDVLSCAIPGLITVDQSQERGRGGQRTPAIRCGRDRALRRAGGGHVGQSARELPVAAALGMGLARPRRRRTGPGRGRAPAFGIRSSMFDVQGSVTLNRRTLNSERQTAIRHWGLQGMSSRAFMRSGQRG